MAAVLSAAQDHNHHFNNLHMYSNGPPSPSHTNDSTDWKSKYYAVEEMLQETRNELDDFQQSSKELEDELERELERTEKAQDELKSKIAKLEVERDDWKSKYVVLQQNHNTTTNSLQRELEAFRQREAIFKDQLRELELGNDDLERNERQATSSLADVEAKYARALEEKILLEHELQDKASLEEQCQRLRDELRDANLEVNVLKEQLDKEQLIKAPPSPSPRRRIIHGSTSSLEIPTIKGDADSLLHSPPPDLLFTDLAPLPLRARASTASETSSIHSRFSRDFASSSSTPPSSVASSTIGSSILNTPTPASILNRALSPTISASGGSRLPRRNLATPLPVSPAPITPRIPSRAISTAALPRSKQMVSEMRARVRTLEQKIHSNMPRLRVGGSQQGNARVAQNAANRAANKENAKVIPESPGWMLVTEDGDQIPASPLNRSLPPSLPPLDFSKPGLITPSRPMSTSGRTIRASPQQLYAGPRSPISQPAQRGLLSYSPAPFPSNDHAPRASSRLATLTSASTLTLPASDLNERPFTPTQIPQPSNTRKIPSKPPTSGAFGLRRRGSTGGSSSGPNTANAGATPGRPQRRNVTTPATPPPPLPSVRPIAKTMVGTERTVSSAVQSALSRTTKPGPSTQIAPSGLGKSKIGRPRFVSGIRGPLADTEGSPTRNVH